MRHVLGERPSMMEGCEFELSHREKPNVYKSRNILKDVWYKAIIETEPKSRLRKLYVRLLKDEFSTPLSEVTKNGALFRPIQPTKLESRLNITIGSIVEADYKNAWWTGFVVKEVGDDKCLVCFDSLSDIILFERKHLRSHLEWLDERTYTCWVLTSKQNDEFLRRLAEEPMFSPGTMVEVNTKFNKVEDFWVPSMIIKEIKEEDGYKYVVKVCNEPLKCNGSKKTPKKTVDLRSLRPRPPPFEVQEYQLEEVVETFHGTGWRQARVMANEGRGMGTVSQKYCLVRFEATKKELLIKKSDLRPLNVWEDGVWKTRESLLTQGSGDKMSDSAMNEKESDMPVSPSGGTTATPLKQVEAEIQRKTSPKKTLPRDHNGSEKDSARENENNEDNNRKRKREENLTFVASVEEDKAKDTTMVLPFKKKLPIWKTIESMEVFKAFPQSPHFSSVVGTRDEDSLEMFAVGMMYTFSGLLEEVKLLQYDNRITSLLRLHCSSAKLEKHGFDVKVPQARISKLFSLRDTKSKKIEELEGIKKVAAEKMSVKVENQRKILELQRMNEELDKEIAQSKSCSAKIVQQLEDVELQFQTTASAPW